VQTTAKSTGSLSVLFAQSGGLISSIDNPQ